MNNRTKVPLSVFLLLTVANVWIYRHRDAYQYTAYANNEILYGPNSSVATEPGGIFSAADIAWARRLTAGTVPQNAPAAEKIKRISVFLLSQFGGQRGIPPPHLMQASAVEAYEALQRSEQARVWCGHFGSMMLLFASAHGIKGRYIEVFNPGNHHVFNEFYIPEWKQWVMTDIYNDFVFARDKAGSYHNGQSLRRAVNSIAPVHILHFGKNGLEDTLLDKSAEAIRAYHTKPNPYYYYKTTNLNTVYTFGTKLKRYLLADSWYYIYLDNGGTNTRHYTKILLLAGWLITGLLLAGALIKKTT